LRSEWDPTNHIENLFQSVKEGVETLNAMEAIANKDIYKRCVKYGYSAIRGSGQFEAACIKWKALPAKERATMISIRTFFGKKYDVYDAQTNSLHSAGVANSFQLQELREVTNDGLISVRDQLEEQDNFVEEQVNFNDAILQMVKSNTMDDNATAFSAMTMNTAKDRRIEELEAQIRTQRLRTTPEGSNSVGGGGSSYGRGRGGDQGAGGGRGGGRGAGGGRGRSNGRRRSDGPANCTKNTKY
jgi:uncharacterized membrane protein YgcG